MRKTINIIITTDNDTVDMTELYKIIQKDIQDTLYKIDESITDFSVSFRLVESEQIR